MGKFLMPKVLYKKKTPCLAFQVILFIARLSGC